MASTNRRVSLTSNSLPVPYACAASTENGGGPGTEAFRAFDGTKNVPGTEWVATTTTGTIYYDFGSRMWALDGYGIQPQSTTRAPKNWTFEGSQDASSWTVLDTRSNQTSWTSNVMVDYTVTGNTTMYRYYRLNISANNGDAGFLEIEEIYLYAADRGGAFLFNLV